MGDSIYPRDFVSVPKQKAGEPKAAEVQAPEEPKTEPTKE